jgi:transposase
VDEYYFHQIPLVFCCRKALATALCQIVNKFVGSGHLFATLDNLQKTTGEDIQIALEDTGQYGFNILRFLRTQGYPTYSYNPYLIKEFAKNQSLRKTKTDKKDTMTIARKLRTDLDKQSFSANPSMIELKYLTRHTARLKEDCTRKKVSCTRMLDSLFPERAPSLGSSSAKHQSYSPKFGILRIFVHRISCLLIQVQNLPSPFLE